MANRCIINNTIIREMQIKFTVKHHLTPVRMAIGQKPGRNTCPCAEIGALMHYQWEYKVVPLLWKAVCSFLKNRKMELPRDSNIPLLGIYPEDLPQGHGLFGWQSDHTHLSVRFSSLYGCGSCCPQTTIVTS